MDPMWCTTSLIEKLNIFMIKNIMQTSNLILMSGRNFPNLFPITDWEIRIWEGILDGMRQEPRQHLWGQGTFARARVPVPSFCRKRVRGFWSGCYSIASFYQWPKSGPGQLSAKYPLKSSFNFLNCLMKNVYNFTNDFKSTNVKESNPKLPHGCL